MGIPLPWCIWLDDLCAAVGSVVCPLPLLPIVVANIVSIVFLKLEGWNGTRQQHLYFYIGCLSRLLGQHKWTSIWNNNVRYIRGRLQTINVIVTLSWNPPPKRHTSDIKQIRYQANYLSVGDHRCFWLATTLVSAVIPLDELLILSCWMVVNCTYFLLKHGAKQCRLFFRHFVGKQNVT